MSDALDELVGLSRRIGEPERDYVVLAEGNTSARVDDGTFLVKASGARLASARREDFLRLQRAPLLEAILADSARPAGELFETARTSAHGGAPSIESFVHVVALELAGARFVVHTHPTAVTGLLCSDRAEELFTAGPLFPDEAVVCGPAPLYVPYGEPGIALARIFASRLREHMEQVGDVPRVILLANHGLVALGESASEVEAVTEMAVKAARIRSVAAAAGGHRPLAPASVRELVARRDEVTRRARLMAAHDLSEPAARSADRGGSPQFGAHAFIWTAEWDASGAQRAIAGAAAAELDFVEIPLLSPTDFPLARTRELLEQYGLSVTTSLGLPADCHLPFNPTGALEFLAGAIELTAALGADTLTGALYTHLGTLTGKPPTDDEVEICAATLKRAARLAGEHGISLGIEAINRYETYLNNTARQVLDLLERIDEPNVFAHLDTYHMNIEEQGMSGAIELLGDRLQYIHLSESDRGTPGSGNVAWDDVFAGLQNIGFRGRLALESFAAVNPALIGATAIWRPLVDSPQQLVVDGLRFLRAKSAQYAPMVTP